MIATMSGRRGGGAGAPAMGPLLDYATHFTNTGAFNISNASNNGSRTGFGDRICTYDPVNDKLIVSGHRTATTVNADGSGGESHKLAKFDIAASKFSSLNMASRYQDFYDPTNGTWPIAVTKIPEGYLMANRMQGGAAVFDGDLLYNFTLWYQQGDVNDRQGFAAIWRRPLDLSDMTNVRGPFVLSSLTLNAEWWDGWIVPIPPAWRSSFGGKKCFAGNGTMSIVSRHSYGVALYAFDPDDMLTASAGDVIDATRVLGYTDAHPMNMAEPEDVGAQSPIWNGTTLVCGAIWPEGTRSVLFFGTHAHGEVSYSGSFNSTDYRAQIWAYDASHLAEVYAGTRQYWDVQPYAIWNPTDLYLDSLEQNPTGGVPHPRGVGFRPSDKTVFLRYQPSAVSEQNTIVTWTLSGY